MTPAGLRAQLSELALRDQAERDFPSLVAACLGVPVTDYESTRLRLAFRAGTTGKDTAWRAAVAHLRSADHLRAAHEARRLGAMFAMRIVGERGDFEESELGLDEMVKARADEIIKIRLTRNQDFEIGKLCSDRVVDRSPRASDRKGDVQKKRD